MCSSERMLDLIKTIRRVAPSNLTILITGETGVGKELFARALHLASPRKDRTFLPFNCTAVPKDMIDSQLFGHRRGAFTGAHEEGLGVIRAAAGGTLFLDEIGEMSAEAQPKLLRFLESGEIHPLGEPKPTTVDVRIVAATNANLDQLVSDGKFREDLFYRLNVLPIHIPPLRERREEVPALVEYFLERFGREMQKPMLRVADETLEYLLLYRWPGNVRQLANETPPHGGARRTRRDADARATVERHHRQPAHHPGRALGNGDAPRPAARRGHRAARTRGHRTRLDLIEWQQRSGRQDARTVAQRPVSEAPASRPQVTPQNFHSFATSIRARLRLTLMTSACARESPGELRRDRDVKTRIECLIKD